MCFPTTQMIMFGNKYRHEMNMMTNEVGGYVNTKKRASQRASLLIIYEFFEICMYLNNQ
jgi:hypothetical protein